MFAMYIAVQRRSHLTLVLTYGTVTAPAIAFNNKPFDPTTNPGMNPALWSDTSTGIYHPAIAGAIGIVSSGVERLRITPTQIGLYQVSTGTATNPNILFNGNGNVTLGMNAINNMIQFSSNNLVNVSIESGTTRFNGQTFTTGNINGSSDLNISGNTTLGTSGSAVTSLTVNSSSQFYKDMSVVNNADLRIFTGSSIVFSSSNTPSTISNTNGLTFAQTGSDGNYNFVLYNSSTPQTVAKMTRNGFALPVLNPIDNSVGEDGMVAYSTQRNTVMQKSNGQWTTVSGGGVEQAFTTSSWVLNGDYYTFTITSPNIQSISIQELVGSNYSPVDVDTILISATNAVLSVPATPDLRFNGRAILIFR